MKWNVDADEVGIDLQLRADGVRLAVFRSRQEVGQALRQAAEAGVDLAGVRVVGSDLRVVTEILGSVTLSRHVARASFGGLWYAVLLSLLLFLFYPQVNVAALVLLGAGGLLAGLTVGSVTWFFGNGSKQFRTHRGLVPSAYTLVADENIPQLSGFFTSIPGNLLRPEQVSSVSEDAANSLEEVESSTQSTPVASSEGEEAEILEPPQYGVRLPHSAE